MRFRKFERPYLIGGGLGPHEQALDSEALDLSQFSVD